jgi:protein-S-isoprenylcysteine O-methyltransferase Ste14
MSDHLAPVDPAPAASAMPSSVPWPPLLLVASVAGAIALQAIVPINWPGLDDLPARLIGYGLGAAGLVLAAWAIATMAIARANVLPHKAASTLVTTGPFRYWRHPIYMADVLILLGLAELTKNVWFVPVAGAFALAVFKLAIEPEERHLEAKFGLVYQEWKQRTRRWF